MRLRALLAFLAASSPLAAAVSASCVPDYKFRDDGPKDTSTADTSAADTSIPDTSLPDAPPPLPDVGARDASGMAAIQADGAVFLIDNQRAHLTHAFSIDTYEVTRGRFKRWVDQGMPGPQCGGGDCVLDPGGPYAATMLWRSRFWDTSLGFRDRLGFSDPRKCTFQNDAGSLSFLADVDGGASLAYNAGNDAYPVNCVTWYQAVAFCWFEGGKRLPTETEWQYVAQAGVEARTYPWGNAPPLCALAIFDDGRRCGFPLPAGSSPGGASKHGLFDLGGSVAEYAWDMQVTPYPAGDTTDFTGAPWPDGGEPYPENAARGGSFYRGTGELANQRRVPSQGDIPAIDMGFRCAKTIL